MRIFWTGARAVVVVAGVSLLPGCGGGGSSAADAGEANVVIACGASDEAWLAMKDLVDTGGAQVDDVRASAITAPASGAALPAASPATFEWSPPASLRHGIDTGAFVWLHFAGAGLGDPLDVIAVMNATGTDGGTAACLAYTPAAAEWARLAAAGGPLTLSIYTAKEDLNVVTQGPFQPSANSVSFTVVP